jgi:hypothetical protein
MQHPFDQALLLTPTSDNHASGASHPAWANMVGPFGGMTAAVLLKAVMQHPALLGEPVSLTVNFCAAVADGAFDVQALPVRTNRSTQHWTMSLVQNGETVITATAVTAVRRTTWSATDAAMPQVAPAAECAAAKPLSLEWTNRFESRPVQGGLPQVWGGQEASSLSQVWVRYAEPRTLDLLALAALCDVFFPRIFVRRASRVPIGTVSFTSYFHTDSAQLAALMQPQSFVFGQAQAQCFRNGFFDHTAHIWSEGGVLLATTNQVVYYKE